MKRIAHKVIVQLQFDELCLSEIAALESFIEDGFDQNKEWGTPAIQFGLEATGVKDLKTDKKAMTSKKILELEKEHAGKEKK